MPTRPVDIPDATPSASTVAVDAVERASTDVTTTTTADPGTGGSTLAVTLRDMANRAPLTGSFKIDVMGTSGIAERMLVTGGTGTGAGSYTVTRGIDGTTGVAHSIGAKVALVTAVQRVEPVDASKQVSYRGRVATFRTPGRAGTTGQKIFALHNATSSPVVVDIDKIMVDLTIAAAAGQAPTVLPAVVRVWKFVSPPTNGTALTKVAEDSALASKSAVTVWGDASADGTGSAVTLTVTLPAGNFVAQELAPRFVVVGTSASTFYESWGSTVFLEEEGVSLTLRALEGICVYLDYALATANAITNHWTASLRWTEYTPA